MKKQHFLLKTFVIYVSQRVEKNTDQKNYGNLKQSYTAIVLRRDIFFLDLFVLCFESALLALDHEMND